MEQAQQMTKMDPARINRDFYYTLAQLQYESVNFIARSENDDIRIKRALTIIEQVREIIKTVTETGSNPDSGNCHPPCYPDSMWKGRCICPHIDDGRHGKNINPTDTDVVNG